MKKFLGIFGAVIISIALIALILWFNAPNIIAHYIAKDLKVPVAIKKIELTKNLLQIQDLKIFNPPTSKTDLALQTQELNISGTLKEIRQERMTINSIGFNNVFVGLEFYNESGSNNNWSKIMKKSENKKPSQRKYLIKTLTINNLHVRLTKANGEVKDYPTIKHMEFYNISDESGFPIEEVQKAIANEILKSIFKQFNLGDLLNPLSPNSIIPKILPFKL